MNNQLKRRIERVFFFSAVVFSLGATVSMTIVAGGGLGWGEAAAGWLLHVLE